MEGVGGRFRKSTSSCRSVGSPSPGKCGRVPSALPGLESDRRPPFPTWRPPVRSHFPFIQWANGTEKSWCRFLASNSNPVVSPADFVKRSHLKSRKILHNRHIIRGKRDPIRAELPCRKDCGGWCWRRCWSYCSPCSSWVCGWRRRRFQKGRRCRAVPAAFRGWLTAARTAPTSRRSAICSVGT